MKERIEKRWALVTDLIGYSIETEFFLGKYCWNGGAKNDLQVCTFRTRENARRAKKKLRCYKNSRIVKVEVKIRLVKELKQ